MKEAIALALAAAEMRIVVAVEGVCPDDHCSCSEAAKAAARRTAGGE